MELMKIMELRFSLTKTRRRYGKNNYIQRIFSVLLQHQNIFIIKIVYKECTSAENKRKNLNVLYCRKEM